jgi:hypothetical protein
LKRILPPFLFAFLYAFCAVAPGYDKEQGKFPPSKEAYAKSVVMICARGAGEGTKFLFNHDKKDYERMKVIRPFSQDGMGVVLSQGGHQYIVTNAHVVIPRKLVDEEGAVTMDKVVSCDLRATDYYERSAPCPVTVVYRSEAHDLAILRVPDEWIAFEPLSMPIGSLSRLEPKDALSGILKPRKGGAAFGYGKVQPDRLIAKTDARTFTMSLKIREGDSGSPIFAYDNGRPIFLGLATAYLEDKARDFYLSIGTGVSLFNEVISKIQPLQISRTMH